jgi:feruloyl esterase
MAFLACGAFHRVYSLSGFYGVVSAIGGGGMRKFAMSLTLGAMLTAAAWGEQTTPTPLTCGNLAKLTLPHTTILKAEPVKAGTLTPPPGNKHPIFGQLPSFCRVTAEAHPSADSHIEIEVWLPLAGWNGKFLGLGNGGFAGYIDYLGLAHAVQRGYAGGATDTGHSTKGADWALSHPEKIADYGFRGIHEMTLSGEAIAQAFYGRPPAHRYFASCSNGGRQALMEAQRFPDDYDGILAGAPANNWTHLLTGGLYAYHTLYGDPASYIPAAKIPTLSAAVLARCNPGNPQGFLDDPRTCHFDPASLLCKGADNDKCLTAPQVTALKALAVGAYESDHKVIWPGYLPGAEDGDGGWVDWITGSAPGTSAGAGFVRGYFDDMVYSNPDLDVNTLKLDEALKAAEAATGSVTDAVNPDLAPFRTHGGKLILYHGWNDPAINALNTVDYYNQVVATAGEQPAAGFIRLFMAPGMKHCGGGPGLASFGQDSADDSLQPLDADHNIYLALEAWVEKGTAPGKIIAAKVTREGVNAKVTLTRPLCAYPKQATYKGSGNRNEAASYVCAAPK